MLDPQANDSPRKNDTRSNAVDAALEVANLWHRSNDAVIDCGIAVDRALSSFNAEKTDEFILTLQHEGVLTPNEARQGVHSPKLVKLRRIGENAELLKRPEVARHLPPGYSTIYQVCVLHDELGGNADVTIPRFLQMVEQGDAAAEKTRTTLTRELLGRETAAVKRAKRRSASARGQPDPRLSAATLEALIDAPAQYDLVAMDVTGRRALLGNDYAPNYGIAECLPVYKVMGEPRAIVVRARLSDLAVVETRLLPACGFRRATEVLLLRRPTTHLVTDTEVIIIAQEMGAPPMLHAFDEWAPDGTQLGLLEVADWVFPGAERRLHLFAQGATDGWTCLDEASSWLKEPSL